MGSWASVNQLRSAPIPGECPMSDYLWKIVGSPKGARSGSQGESMVLKKLARLGCDAIASFERERRYCRGRLGDGRVWAAARVCNEGHLSDDSFSAFRNWVILQGKHFYERVLSDPDSLSEIEGVAPEDWRNEYLDWVASHAIEGLGDNPLDFDFGEEILPDEEALYSWQNLTPAELAIRFPSIWKRYGRPLNGDGLYLDSDGSELPEMVRFSTGDVAGVGETVRIGGYGPGVVLGIQRLGSVVVADVKFDSRTATFVVEVALPGSES